MRCDLCQVCFVNRLSKRLHQCLSRILGQAIRLRRHLAVLNAIVNARTQRSRTARSFNSNDNAVRSRPSLS
jgi:hypothetical protein